MRGQLKYLLGAALLVVLVAASAVAVSAAPTQQSGPSAPQNGAAAPYGRGMMGWGSAFNLPTVVAKVIKAEVADVVKDRQAGKSFAEIAAAKGVSKDALVTGILAERKAALDERVKAGGLTAEQEQLMLGRMKEQITSMVDQKGTGPLAGAGAMAGDCPCYQGQAPAAPGQNQSYGPGSRGGMMRGGFGMGLNR